MVDVVSLKYKFELLCYPLSVWKYCSNLLGYSSFDYIAFWAFVTSMGLLLGLGLGNDQVLRHHQVRMGWGVLIKMMTIRTPLGGHFELK